MLEEVTEHRGGPPQLPGFPRGTLGYSIRLISVCQPEPGLCRATPLGLAAQLLGNSQ